MIYFPSSHLIDQIKQGKFELFHEMIEDYGVEAVDFSYKAIDPQTGPMIAKALQGMPVKVLNLGFNQLGPQGSLELAQALKDTQVEELDLSRNEIGPAVADVVASLKATTVKWVKLGFNRIGVEGAAKVRPLLKASGLKADLSHNLIWS